MNKGGELGLLVYGKPIAVHLDPIEKKPLYHFLPGSSAFSIGTIGCNFSCKFCQNWDISQVTKEVKAGGLSGSAYEKEIGKICSDGMGLRWGEEGREKRDDEWLSLEKAVETCVSGGIPSIAYTYNEPTIFIEYARDIGVRARAAGIKNVLVTNGYESPECLEFCRDWVDAMNIDLKAFSEKTYASVCGASLKGVLDTIQRAVEMGIWVELTTLVIPGMNDSEEELKKIARFIARLSCDIPWHVTAFYPCYKMMDREPTSDATLMRAWEIGKAAGLKYVYTGNILGGHHNTECPKCGEILIKRSGMGCEENKVAVGRNGTGKCPKCGEKIAGVWR
jgi:pyruvate formate lyase activating enzyme